MPFLCPSVLMRACRSHSLRRHRNSRIVFFITPQYFACRRESQKVHVLSRRCPFFFPLHFVPLSAYTNSNTGIPGCFSARSCNAQALAVSQHLQGIGDRSKNCSLPRVFLCSTYLLMVKARTIGRLGTTSDKHKPAMKRVNPSNER
jgi:hypothetical protein